MTKQLVEKVIRIDVVQSAESQRNIKMLADSMKGVETHAEKMKKSLDDGFGGITGIVHKAASAFAALGLTLGAGAITRSILEMGSAYQVLGSRMQVVLGSQLAATTAQQDIIRIAINTGREIDGISRLYDKAARAAQAFGYSQQLAGKIAESFANSLRLSGSSTQEAYAASVQFGQALASGRLQGDEFRSMMENNAVFMYELAKAMGVTVTQMRTMGSEGQLSSDKLFGAMVKKGADGLTLLERLNKMAAALPLTFAQSAESVKTSMLGLVGAISDALEVKATDKLGIFGPLIRGIQSLTEVIKRARIEADALNEGGFSRLLRIFDSLGLSGSPAKMIGTALKRQIFGEKEEPLSAVIEKQIAEDSAALEKAKAVADRHRKVLGDENIAGLSAEDRDRRRQSLSRRVADADKDVAEVELRLASARSELNKLRYGDAYIDKAPDKAPPKDLDKGAKSAKESLEDYSRGIYRELRLEQDLASAKQKGSEDDKKYLKEIIELEDKLREAKKDGFVLDKPKEQSLRNALRITRDLREQREADERDAAQRKKDFAEVESEAEKVRALLEKDQAAIDAILNKVAKADQNEVELLKRGRDRIVDAIDLMGPKSKDGYAVTEAYKLLDLYDQAIKKRAELTEVQAVKKSNEAQAQIDNAKVKQNEKLADEINTALKKGIIDGKGQGSIGDQLWKNLQSTVKGKVLDIVINPVTSFFSKILANLADSMSSMFSKKIAEAFSNKSSDPIGTLMGFFGGSGSGGSGLFGNLFSGIGKIFGFHADGLAYVPYDNYPAMLHRGERVLTAQENRSASTGEMGPRILQLTSAPTISIDARTDAAQVRGLVADSLQRNNRQLMEELHAQGVV